MTDVLVRLTTPSSGAVASGWVPADEVAAVGHLECRPYAPDVDGARLHLEAPDRLLLPASMPPVRLVGGEALLHLAPTGAVWCWQIIERTPRGKTRYVLVPDSAATLDYADLVDVDPTTLVAWSPADPEAAYLAAIGDAVDDYLTENPVYVAFPQVSTLTLPASPATGQSVSVLADSTTVIPEGVRWDSGGAPIIAAAEQRIVTLIWTGTDWVGTYSLAFNVPVAPVDTTDPEWTATFTMGTPGETTVTATASALATDDTGVTGYQVSYDDGATNAPIGVSGFDFTLTGTASTTYATTKLRAVDGAGNVSAWLSVPSYTMDTPADVNDPEWTATFTLGTPTSSTCDVTPSALATDNVAVTSYEQTLDSTAGTVVWTDIGMPVGGVLTITGMTADTTYANVALRAKDAAGNTSTVLAVPSITTAAPAAPPALGWVGSYYADDLTLADGDLVVTWADHDGRAASVLGSVVDRRPVYRASDADFGGAPVVDFNLDGVPYLKTQTYPAWSAVSQPYTVVAVATFPFVKGEQSNLFHGENAGYEHGLYRHPTTSVVSVDGGSGKPVTTAPTDGLAHLFAVVFNGASSTLTIDDDTQAVTGDVGTETSVGLILGASDTRSATQPFRGSIAFAGVVPGVLSAGDLAALWAWTQGRYGL